MTPSLAAHRRFVGWELTTSTLQRKSSKGCSVTLSHKHIHVAYICMLHKINNMKKPTSAVLNLGE